MSDELSLDDLATSKAAPAPSQEVIENPDIFSKPPDELHRHWCELQNKIRAHQSGENLIPLDEYTTALKQMTAIMYHLNKTSAGPKSKKAPAASSKKPKAEPKVTLLEDF